MNLPHYIKQAADLGLLQVEDGKVVGCKRDEVETVMGITRIIEKIQPTTAAKQDNTVDQESIILCRVLSSPSGRARELWSDLRVAFGIGHGQTVPDNLWSTPVLRAIGQEIDRTFLGERNASLISRESLINQYEQLAPASRSVGFQEFAKTLSDLASPETMKSYGDPKAEWSVALDILRQQRVRALYKETLHMASQVSRSDSKLEKNIEFLQSRAMECIGMLRGSIGNQGNAVSIVDSLFGTDTRAGIIDRILAADEQEKPISTGIAAMDIDIEGGIRHSMGGRLFTLAARTGIGKTVLGVHVATQVALAGACVGFISAELGEDEIASRLLASLSRKVDSRNCAGVGDIASPDQYRQRTVERLAAVAQALQANEGKLLVETPWGACVDSVVNSMRSMKAKNPNLRLVVLDHFHCLARHKGAPSNEAAMMEDRSYRLMTAAKELDVDVLVLAQMNRVGMDALNAKQPPQLNEIRGTDALSHVSHAVWIVRKHMEGEGDQKVWNKKLEIWHSKTRGRQAYWDDDQQRMVTLDRFVESGILEMDYGFSSVGRDDTLALAKRGMNDTRLNF